MAVTDEAIEKLKAMIMSGELAPGQRPPREADLATTLGLSRSSLREAVRALSLVRILGLATLASPVDELVQVDDGLEDAATRGQGLRKLFGGLSF